MATGFGTWFINWSVLLLATRAPQTIFTIAPFNPQRALLFVLVPRALDLCVFLAHFIALVFTCPEL